MYNCRECTIDANDGLSDAGAWEQKCDPQRTRSEQRPMGFVRTQNKKIKYCFNGISEQNQRPSNMDSLIILEKNIESDYLLLAVVSDGVGSLKHGAFAATALTRGLMGWFTMQDSVPGILESLRAEILLINAEIFSASSQGGFETAATLSVLLVINDKYYAINVGDSRIYAMRNGKLTQLTCDDVSETGALTAYLGFEMPPNLHIHQGDARSSLFLLCSDGLYKRMDLNFWMEQLSGCKAPKLRRCMDALVHHAIDRGERDNISVAMIMDCTKG